MTVVEHLYRLKLEEFQKRVKEMTDPRVIYVTDLVSCSNKRVMRQRYPLLGFRFEPQLILGDLVHAGLEGIMASTGEWRAEVEVRRKLVLDNEEYEIIGRVDLVRYKNDKPVEIVEVKTVRQLQEQGPYEHHVLQLRVYMELMRVETGFLVYVAPDRLVEYQVSYEPVNLEEYARQTIYNIVRPRYAWECKYCPYRRLCPYTKTES